MTRNSAGRLLHSSWNRNPRQLLARLLASNLALAAIFRQSERIFALTCSFLGGVLPARFCLHGLRCGVQWVRADGGKGKAQRRVARLCVEARPVGRTARFMGDNRKLRTSARIA